MDPARPPNSHRTARNETKHEQEAYISRLTHGTRLNRRNFNRRSHHFLCAAVCGCGETSSRPSLVSISPGNILLCLHPHSRCICASPQPVFHLDSCLAHNSFSQATTAIMGHVDSEVIRMLCLQACVEQQGIGCCQRRENNSSDGLAASSRRSFAASQHHTLLCAYLTH